MPLDVEWFYDTRQAKEIWKFSERQADLTKILKDLVHAGEQKEIDDFTVERYAGCIASAARNSILCCSSIKRFR